MDKSKIYWFIGIVCISAGACIINEGLALILLGVFLLIYSYIEYIEKEEAEESTKVWHDLTETPPPDSGVIILRDSTHSLIESCIIGFWSVPQNIFRDQQDVVYNWHFINNELIYDQWCYLDDII